MVLRRWSLVVWGLLLAGGLSLGVSVSHAAERPLWPAASELTLAGNPLVPGGAFMSLNGVSCTSIGNCTAVGNYSDNASSLPIVATETGGVWGSASKLTVPPNANSTGFINGLLAVSCSRPGTCVAAGTYQMAASVLDLQPMVFVETGGTWGPAIPVTLPADAEGPPAVQLATLNDVTCTSPGNCVAVGRYGRSDDSRWPMVVTETNGQWGTAQVVGVPQGAPATAIQNAGLNSVTCASQGNCVAVGGYVDSTGDGSQPMVMVEAGGTWGQPSAVALPPGAASAGIAQFASFSSVSCVGVGTCVAVGQYEDTRGSFDFQAMVAAEAGGVWAQAARVKLPANLATATGAQSASLGSVACTSVGNCVAVGSYNASGSTATIRHGRAMDVTETGGAWGHATELTLPANAATSGNFRLGQMNSVSCPSLGSCAAVGGYTVGNSTLDTRAMVANSVGSLSIPTGSLPWDRVGSRYHATLAAVGGAGRYRWTISAGALPRGLALNARSGVISGVPLRAGPLKVTVSVSDPGPPAQTVSRSLGATIMPALRPHTRLLSMAISPRRHRARFTFAARGYATGFLCALQRVTTGSHRAKAKPHFRSCRSPTTYVRLRSGTYVFSVAATGPSGPDRAPTRRKFSIG